MGSLLQRHQRNYHISSAELLSLRVQEVIHGEGVHPGLAEQPLPRRIQDEVVEAGVPGLSLPPHLDGLDELLAVHQALVVWLRIGPDGALRVALHEHVEEPMLDDDLEEVVAY